MSNKVLTRQQQKALHLWYKLLADLLNENGFDMKKTLKQDVDIMWTPYNIKEFVWRPVQKALSGKESTTKITTHDINQIYDVVNKTIGERTGLHVPFPNLEELEKELDK